MINFLAIQSKLENKAMKKLLLKNIVVAKKRKGLKEHQLKNLPTVDHIHEVDSCTCPNCQKFMKEISTSLVRQEVRFIPARMENHRHFQKTYACSNCEKTGTPYTLCKIRSTKTSVKQHSSISFVDSRNDVSKI